MISKKLIVSDLSVDEWSSVPQEYKFLPNQAANCSLFGDQDLPKSMFEAIRMFSSKSSRLPHQLGSGLDVSSSLPSVLLVELLASIIKPMRALEIGTFTGKMTMALARHSEMVYTIESQAEAYRVAQENFRYAGLEHNIVSHHGDAKEMIVKYTKDFDLIFIDGDKENYDFYFHNALGLLSDGGIIIVDDVFFHGDALNQEPFVKTDKGRGVKAFLEMFKKTEGFKVVLPISNGIAIYKGEENE